jgi:hypothetical protein
MSSRASTSRQPSRPLTEGASGARLGTVVGWKTPAGREYGVVLGQEGKFLLCLTTYEKSLKKDPGLRLYRDAELTGKLSLHGLLPGFIADVQKVPAARATKQNRLVGKALQPFLKAAEALKLEGVMYREANAMLEEIRKALDEKKWIQTAVKKPGRLPKILGIKADDWEAMDKGAKLKAIDAKLKELEGDSGEAAKSMRGALTLGKRFVGGEFKKECKDGEPEPKEEMWPFSPKKPTAAKPRRSDALSRHLSGQYKSPEVRRQIQAKLGTER